MTDSGARWRSMIGQHQGLSADASLLGILLARYWRGDGLPLGTASVYDLFMEGGFPTWEAYTDALRDLHVNGFISTHGRRGRPNLLLLPDLPSQHMAGGFRSLQDRSIYARLSTPSKGTR